MSSRKLTIIVAGAGIGGLTAAVALRRAGHKVTVYEKASLSHEVGQGITISPNGGRILRNLGFDFEKARTIDFAGTNIVRAETLDTMAPFQDFRGYDKQFGIQMVTAYRISMHAALVDLACEEEDEGEPVTIVTSCGVESFDGDNGSVTLESGEKVTGDLIIAADGVKSSAAAHINGPDCPPLESSDTIVYRFTLPEDTILSDLLTKELLDAGPGMCNFNVGPTGDRWLVRYWCRDDGLQNFALYILRNPDESMAGENELRYRTDRSHLLKELKGFHPALLRLAEMTTDVLPLWRCTTREPLKTLHRGKLVVIGDAAHPVKPHIGQGAISAIEDAAVLGTLFTDLPSSGDLTDQISQRLRLNDKLRIPRIAAYKYYSDVPAFRNAVEEQRENCEKFNKPEDLPGRNISVVEA